MSRHWLSLSLLTSAAAWAATITAVTAPLESVEGLSYNLFEISSAVACGTLILGVGGPLVTLGARVDSAAGAVRWFAAGLLAGAAIAVMAHRSLVDEQVVEDLLNRRDSEVSPLLGVLHDGLRAQLPVLAGVLVLVAMSIPALHYVTGTRRRTEAAVLP